jgi:hypothetical protein
LEMETSSRSATLIADSGLPIFGPKGPVLIDSRWSHNNPPFHVVYQYPRNTDVNIGGLEEQNEKVERVFRKAPGRLDVYFSDKNESDGGSFSSRSIDTRQPTATGA